jgi:ribonuclease T2
MPDPQLIHHEWEAHGTCTGMTADAYFALVRRAFDSVRIPPEFRAPMRMLRVSPAEFESAFHRWNPALSRADMAPRCRGRYLSSIEICLSRTLQPIESHPMSTCEGPVMLISPVR